MTTAVQYGPSILARPLPARLPVTAVRAGGRGDARALRLRDVCWDARGRRQAVRRGLIKTELKIKKGLRRSPIIRADETWLRVKGKLTYVHVVSSARLTH